MGCNGLSTSSTSGGVGCSKHGCKAGTDHTCTLGGQQADKSECRTDAARPPRGVGKVLMVDGQVQQFTRPLKAAEILMQHPHHSLCPAVTLERYLFYGHMQTNTRLRNQEDIKMPVHLLPDDVLHVGQIYLLIPLRTFRLLSADFTNPASHANRDADDYKPSNQMHGPRKMGTQAPHSKGVRSKLPLWRYYRCCRSVINEFYTPAQIKNDDPSCSQGAVADILRKRVSVIRDSYSYHPHFNSESPASVGSQTRLSASASPLLTPTRATNSRQEASSRAEVMGSSLNSNNMRVNGRYSFELAMTSINADRREAVPAANVTPRCKSWRPRLHVSNEFNTSYASLLAGFCNGVEDSETR